MRLKDLLPIVQACCSIIIERKVCNVDIFIKGDAVQLCDALDQLGIGDCVVDKMTAGVDSVLDKVIRIWIRDFDKLEGDT